MGKRTIQAENRMMETKEEVYSFPKHHPRPVSVRAKSREEAEEKVRALSDNK